MANLLNEDLPENPDYHISDEKIIKIFNDIMNWYSANIEAITYLSSDDREGVKINNIDSIPEFYRFEMAYKPDPSGPGTYRYSHINNANYTNTYKMYCTIGTFLHQSKIADKSIIDDMRV